MGSYVISVSAGTGCYRHILISKSATLYKLHKAIIGAFGFVDDHAHAFFMDNRYWSSNAAFFSMKMNGDERLTKSYKLEKLHLVKGSQFKYVFDFGDEWRFQCKVLRESDEKTDIPGVIRVVGKAPQQYPDWDEEDWDDEDLDAEDILGSLTRVQIEELYELVPLSGETINLIHQYMDAAARLYGLISLTKLREIYNQQNEPVDAGAFAKAAAVVDCEDNDYWVIERIGMPKNTDEELLEAAEIIADYLFVEEPDWSIENLRRQQKGKNYKVLPKEEFLRYADPVYFPDTQARTEMMKYLRRRSAKLSLPVDDFCDCMQSIIVIDAPIQKVINIVESEGLVFNGRKDFEKFASLYKDLNNSTHKHANCGYTPDEMVAMSRRGKKDAARMMPIGQMSLFDKPEKGTN